MKRADPIAAQEAPATDEPRLVSEVLAKDRKATALFVTSCADWVYPFVVRRLTPRMDLVEDLVQETLLAAWQNLPNFRGDSGLRPWVLGIARHKVEDYYRKRLREALQEDEDGQAEPAATPDFEEKLHAADQEERVGRTLALLPEAYGVALLWRYRDGRSIRDIAQLTGKTEKAVERLLARARETFKRRWQDAQP